MAVAPESNHSQQEVRQDVGSSHGNPALSLSEGNISNNTGDQPAQPSSARPTPPTGTNVPPIAAPHPKRFSAVNINKKFLQKDFAPQGPASTSSNSVAAKSSGPTAQQQSTPRSRLLTTKLTTTPSSGPHGTGWSRPSSTAPSPASTTPQGNEKSHTPLASQNSKAPSAQQRPSSATKDRQSSASPVWGSLKSTTTTAPVDPATRNDFPTAAEVAQETSTKKTKPSQEVATEPVTSAQVRQDEADTFRGVHLDPNAHHWDEMEEDDDNFLGGVVEFDDGKQYKVEPASTPPSSQDIRDERPPTPGNDGPVSKEERFGNDIDRHWPRGQPSDLQRNGSISPASSHQSPRLPYDSSRVLFNERSNRLEPYSANQRTSSFSSRRGSQHEPSGKPRVVSDGQRQGPFSRSHDSGPRSGSNAKTAEGAWNSRHTDRPVPERGRRLSNMGPPPVPSYARNSSTESVRQLPPHLSQPPPFHERERRLSRESHHSRDNQIQLGREDSWLSPRLTNVPISPALSTSSKLPPESPVELTAGVNIDDIRKDVMHTAAERAKKRRQQEEEEREKERERARKKAVELEAKLGLGKPSEDKGSAAIEDQVDAFIADAVSSVGVPKVAVTSPTSPKSVRTPSLKGVSRQVSDPSNARPFPGRRTSSAYGDTEPPTAASQAESWRSRKVSTSAPQPPEKTQDPVPQFPPTFPPPVSVLEEKPGEELEVVDFSDMGRLVGVTESQTPKEADKPKEKPSPWSRPVASDFFDDQPAASKPLDEPWRKAEATSSERAKPHEQSHHRTPSGHFNAPSPTHTRSYQRPTNHYKEATMSTLDDTISRIKGAIHDMHEPNGSHKSTLLNLKQERWLPRSRRVPDALDFDQDHREVFDVSGAEPPHSPPPAWHTFVVSLGKSKEPLEPVNQHQLVLWEKTSLIRWDVMSWDPPVEGMSRTDFSLNDVLFRKPSSPKGKFKYRVSLPRPGPRSGAGPRVNLPNKPVGAFGRARDTNDTTSWRKPMASPIDSLEAKTNLSTTSRSPPPADAHPSSQNISESKLIAKPSVERSGLGRDPSTSPRVSFATNVNGVPSTIQTMSIVDTQPPSPFSSTSAKVENSSSDESAERPVTPPQRHPNTTWAKSPLAFTTLESPAKGPNSDHLKAVWSQTPEKSHIPTSNSLEGIGDDLTALTFTIPEVKSEDGETPPPQPAAPTSRMAFDVTRAFQKVPSSDASRNAPPTTPAPPAPIPRHASFGYVASPSARPAYPAAYPAQVAPSPGPGMYPNPMQPRMSMNGQPTQVYPQPVWMVQGPPMASPGGMMRPLPSPYSMPMMPFSPGTHVYTMPPPPMSMNGAMPPRAMPPPSPIMFPASPVMMPPPLQRQPSQTYMPPPPAPIGRGQNHRTPSGQGYSNPGFMNQGWRS